MAFSLTLDKLDELVRVHERTPLEPVYRLARAAFLIDCGAIEVEHDDFEGGDADDLACWQATAWRRSNLSGGVLGEGRTLVDAVEDALLELTQAGDAPSLDRHGRTCDLALEVANEAPSAEEDDEPCPKGDPDCVSADYQCHDACSGEEE